MKYIQSPVSGTKHLQQGYLPVQSVITPNAGLITSGPTGPKQTLIIRNAQPGAQMPQGQIVTPQQVLVRNPSGNKIMGVPLQGQNTAVHQPVIRQIPAPAQSGQGMTIKYKNIILFSFACIAFELLWWDRIAVYQNFP